MTEIDRRRLLALAGAFGLLGATGAGATPRTDRRWFGARFDGTARAELAAVDAAGRDIALRPLPSRGHGLSIAPDGRSVVVLGRRPGTWGMVAASDDLRPLAMFAAPGNRRFCGHGAHGHDGRLFLTTEIGAEGEGLVGVWDVRAGYVRVGEWSTGGIGPHDLAILPDGHVVVANGGLRADPATGRDVIEPETMRSDLVVLAPSSGEIVARGRLDPSMRAASIRHLDVAADGEIVFGCQFEGAPQDEPPLVGAWRPGGGRAPVLYDLPEAAQAALKRYIGSVALDRTGRLCAATSPRGNTVVVFDRACGSFLGAIGATDACGVAATGDDGGFALTRGAAGFGFVDVAEAVHATAFARSGGLGWDNHLVGPAGLRAGFGEETGDTSM